MLKSLRVLYGARHSNWPTRRWPECSKKPPAPRVVTASKARPIASTRASRVRAPARLSSAFTLANASQIGLKFGEYDGRNNSSQSRAHQFAYPVSLVRL